ncbi:hypothetical protein SDC9_82080 [bioreactor metagenome]|uniref:Flagellar biosynthetic protein FliR n=1 Tax=bioreactor metagenome TaxID=1076179 RepID=A0A644Z4E5_9ZZZZ
MQKIGFCAVLTLVFLTAAGVPAVYPQHRHLLEYIFLCLKELLFGVAMGYVLNTMFAVALTAGSLVDYQIGYSMANVYDAQNNIQAPITGSLFNMLLLLLFFAVDGHLRLIEILYRTIELVPVGQVILAPEIVWAAAEVMSKSFVLAVMAAMPVLASGLLLEVAMGATIRTVPQMNMFVVGIPLKLIVGLLMFALTLTVFADFSKLVFTKAFEYIDLFFLYLGSGT